MKRIFMNMFKTGAVLLLLFASNTWAISNSGYAYITSVIGRDSGFHSLFIDVAVPDPGCDIDSRAVIDLGDEGGDSLLSMALAAFMSGKQVRIGVEGCATYNPGVTQQTAPKVVKLQIYD